MLDKSGSRVLVVSLNEWNMGSVFSILFWGVKLIIEDIWKWFVCKFLWLSIMFLGKFFEFDVKRIIVLLWDFVVVLFERCKFKFGMFVFVSVFSLVMRLIFFFRFFKYMILVIFLMVFINFWRLLSLIKWWEVKIVLILVVFSVVLIFVCLVVKFSIVGVCL